MFIAFKFARTADLLWSSFVILLLFKFLFTLKRTEIQLDDDNMTVQQTCKALKRYICFERVIIAFYALSSSIIMFFVVWDSMLVVQRLNDNSQILNRTVVWLWWLIIVYFPILFVADMFTMCYFIRMARNYFNLMNQWYSINERRFYCFVYGLAF